MTALAGHKSRCWSTELNDVHDLELILRSRVPVIAIESHDEAEVLALISEISIRTGGPDYRPVHRWSVTDGLTRHDVQLEETGQAKWTDPEGVLRYIRTKHEPAIYVLLDFHPYLNDPLHTRLVKDIALDQDSAERTVILISHRLTLPPELEPHGASFQLTLPDRKTLATIVRGVAREWKHRSGAVVKADAKALDLLIHNLAGLTATDARRLARKAIFNDGAVSHSDLAAVMQAKYQLLDRSSALRFEYDTAEAGAVGGHERLKDWLAKRRAVFAGKEGTGHLDPPRGVLLTGVQGCGKSLLARATAGIFGVPLVRVDFGSLYDKYHGETERKLREALATAEVLAPCVLWADEIEKGLAGRGGETGTTQRVLGTFLTWLAEHRSRVFIVATANDLTALPPELIRKGRFDEIFFVDLPSPDVRADIFAIHLGRRGLDPQQFNLPALVGASDEYSGAEIEQAVVSAMYSAHNENQALTSDHILSELDHTRPLAVVMAERVAALRQWAADRAVASH